MSRNTATNRKRSNRFAQVPGSAIQRSKFDRSFGYKTTFNGGELIPIVFEEVLPGDTFDLNMTQFVRMNTLVTPFFDNVYLDSFWFFVPSRLVWSNWQAFCGEQAPGQVSTDYLIPTLDLTDSGTSFASETIFDYVGLPTNVKLNNTNNPINSLPFRAYNLIYNEWFRDENLIDPVEVPLGDGPDDLSTYKLLKRAKRHDYFTSALPWPQKGPSVDVGLSGNAPVVGFGSGSTWQFSSSPDSSTNTSWALHSGSISYKPVQGGGRVPLLALPNAEGPYLGFENQSGKEIYYPLTELSGSNDTGSYYFNGAQLQPSSGVAPYADLSGVSAITINDLRQAFQIQKFYEKWARGGSRYTETLRVMFNVISPDARLQRPEFLGSGSTRINVIQTAQTSSTDSTSPQSNLTAYGISGATRHGFTHSFVEHGYVVGIICARADITYQQGISRMWSRRGIFDFYWPTLAHLGEQTILNQEIYAQGTSADNDVFGYQERYAEYRYHPSQITGKLRSTDSTSLDVWHLAQKFDTLPTLSQDFIEENPPFERVAAIQNEPIFFGDFWFDFKCLRPMPVFGVPGLVDHF